MRTQIRVSCIDQQLKIVASPILASGGLNEAEVVFDFCEKWDGFAKTGVFYRDEENVYYSLLDEDDTCIVPHEVYDEPGAFYFTVIGDRDDIRRTASTVRYKAQKGVVGEGMIPSDPTPDVYDQIINLMTEVNEKVDSGAMAGPQGEPGYTPVKGVDYFDGYTPVKGVDYFDGEKGADGYTPIKGVDYFDGKDGKDGQDGANGDSGYSPTVRTEEIDGGTRLVVNDAFGDHPIDILNGKDGKDGGSNTLIVTGNFPTSETVVNGVAYASIVSADSGMNLSHTVAEMVEAFQAGRDVKIRLTSADYGTTKLGGWDFRHAELSVFEAEDIMDSGMYAFYAYGTGYTYYKQEAAPLFIECSLNPSPRIYVHVKTETATYAGEVEVN